MLCSISGNVPQMPVLSVKSGYIFEKRLIEHEIEEHGICPITKEPLTKDDLVDINSEKMAKPRSSTGTSIPGLLNIFHNEWDALMLECHSLRQSLTGARQELSQALYQHDAACRVIARLIRERDAAREFLAKMQQSQQRQPSAEDERPTKKMLMGITQEMSNFISARSEELEKRREQQEMSDEIAQLKDLKNYSLLTSQPLHATKQGGILALAYHPTLKNILASGGEDSTIQIFDQSSGTIVTSIEEHYKKVYSLHWIADSFLASCSADKSVRIWVREAEATEMKVGLNLRHHEDEVISITSTVNARFIFSASKDGTIGFIDLEQGKNVEKLTSSLVDCGYTSAKCHPDGRLLASGTEAGDVHIWDLSQQKIIHSLIKDETEDGHCSMIRGIGFHQDGFHMASACEEMVKIWDLRKMEIVKNLEISPVSSITFDHEGRYFAVGGEGVRILDVSQDYEEVVSFSDFPGMVKSIDFGENVTRVVVGSIDHNLRIYGHD